MQITNIKEKKLKAAMKQKTGSKEFLKEEYPLFIPCVDNGEYLVSWHDNPVTAKDGFFYSEGKQISTMVVSFEEQYFRPLQKDNFIHMVPTNDYDTLKELLFTSDTVENVDESDKNSFKEMAEILRTKNLSYKQMMEQACKIAANVDEKEQEANAKGEDFNKKEYVKELAKEKKKELEKETSYDSQSEM